MLQLEERPVPMTKRPKLATKPRPNVSAREVANNTLRRYPKVMAKLAE